MTHFLKRRGWAGRVSALTLSLCSAGAASADTSAFTITDDPALNATLSQVRADYLAMRATNQPAFTKLDVVVLLPNTDGTWRRGSVNPNVLTYPASVVKLAYLASGMYWCQTNGHPYNYLDADIGPMIRISDNYACGRTVDAITGAPNIPDLKKTSDSRWAPWYDKRQYTEYFLAARGLFENQIVLNKTYPTNSGSGPVGAENLAISVRGAGNRMQPKCVASLMLEIQKGAIEPGALSYMNDLLTHERFSGDSVFGFGLPPGTKYYNKWGAAYDNLNDVAYIQLPNGKEMILAAFTNAYSGTEPSQPYPYDTSCMGPFAEMLIEELGLDATGNPPKVRVDDGTAGFSLSGSWSTGTSAAEKYGPSYAFKSGGTGAGSATWSLNVPEAGLYEVCVWHSEGTNRATDAPFTVNHAGGATTVRVNQQKVGGRWYKLGNFNFNVGSGSITLTDAVADSTKVVIADAVKATKWPAGAEPIPDAPSNLTATAASKSQINLVWQDNSSNETEFVIEYKVGSGVYSALATVGANTTSYSATGLAARTTYTFRVKARNSGGYGSSYSNEASATTPRR